MTIQFCHLSNSIALYYLERMSYETPRHGIFSILFILHFGPSYINILYQNSFFNVKDQVLGYGAGKQCYKRSVNDL